MENFDYRAEITGPDPEWFAELAELAEAAGQARNALWPVPVSHTRAGHKKVIADLMRASVKYNCPDCGGPPCCPTLESTLPYRRCGYAEVPGIGWVHQ